MRRFLISIGFVSISLFLWSCGSISDEKMQVPTGEELKISWENISNFIGDRPGFRAEFSLENNSSYTFRDSGWALYFNQTPRRLIGGSVTGPVLIENINGDFYRLSPAEGFQLNPGETVTISADFEDWVIKETDAPSGIYFVYTDEQREEIVNVPIQNYIIKPFEKPEQINRFRGDETPIPTPEWRFEQNKNLTLLSADKLHQVVPTPVSIVERKEIVRIDSGLMIHYKKDLEKEAEFLAGMLTKVLGTRPIVTESEIAGPNIVLLKTSAISVGGIEKEAYQLVIDPESISILGSDPAGVFYGIQSFLSLLPIPSLYKPAGSIDMRALSIHDSPAFEYRGMHLDLARNFQNKSTIRKLIDILSFYKMNKLHLHLTDDEGWRIEIEELPELTSVGAFRGHTLDEKEHLAPAYGSGPFPDPETSHGNGYLSRDDFKEIIKYAYDRHIEVIPEINMPGHARAAIYAMKARYRRLMETGNREAAEEFLLSDPNDTSTYLSAQFYDDNVVCVCKESVYRFYETVVDDVIEMYQEADVPLSMIHTGGDEVPGGVWEGSPICGEFLSLHTEINGAKGLQPYFFRKLVERMQSNDLKIGGWEEVVMRFRDDRSWAANEEFIGENVVPYVWNSIWGNEDLGYRLANAGYPVILCNVNNFYFDMAYNKHPEEPGLYWGGFVNTRNSFDFIPFDLFKSTAVSPMGIPFDEERDFRNMERLRPDARKNILGIQGELWSETVKGQDMLEYYYLPKLIGLSQRAWQGQADWGSIRDYYQRSERIDLEWNIFANTLGQKEFPRLDHIFGGFNYRIPVPGARITGGKLEANLSFPGMAIRYTTDGSDPDDKSEIYREAVELSGTIKLRAFDTRGRGGRIVSLKGR